ncbi:MAG TPA: PKD domain-containing protein [Terriglobia bacterium]|nr:PKD domain-containing protein [Terriglobia bacterium]
MKKDKQSIARGRRPGLLSRTAVAVACSLAVVLLTLSAAPDAAWSQGLPVKTCANGINAYLCKGDILVADGNSDAGKGRVILVNPVTGNQTSIAHGLPYLTEPVGVIFDPNDNNLLVINGITSGIGQINGVIRVNPGTGDQTLLSSGFDAPFAIALDNNGNIFVADSGYSATDPAHPLVNRPGRILKVDRNTGAQTLWATGGYVDHPYGIAFDGGNTNLLYVTDATSFNGQGAIYSLDPANINSPPRLIWGPSTANPAPVVPQSSPLGCPLGLTVEGTGNLLATAFSYPAPPPNAIYGCVPPGIFRIDLINHVQVTMTDNNTTPPLSWNLPFGIDTEDNGTSTGNIIVVDEGLRMVFRLNPTPYDPAHPLANFIAPIPLSRDGFFVTPVGLSLRKTQPTVNIAVPPSATINVPSNPQEGTPITLTATVIGDSSTYSWTVKHGSTVVAEGTAASLTFTPDDSVTYDATLAVTNGAGTGSASATFVVANVAPSGAITNIPSNSPEGTAITLNSSVTDPSGVDTAAGFTYSWIVTKNSVQFALGTGPSLTFTPTDSGPYAVSLSVTDKDGGTGTTSGTVTIANVAPTPSIGGPASGVVGTPISLTGSATDPSSVDTAAGFTFAWSVTKNGSPFTTGTGSAFSFTPDASGSYVATLTASDKDAGAGTASKTIGVVDVTPTVTIIGAPVTSVEGTAIALTSAVTGTGTLSYSWSTTRNGSPFPAGSGTGNSLSLTPDDNGAYVVTLMVGNTGGIGTDSKSINVTNVAPVVAGVPALVSFGTSGTINANFTANFTDAGKNDTHTCILSWDDGSNPSPGTVTESNGSGSCVGTHTFTQVGVYTVSVTVTDDDGGAGTDSNFLVVYDPTAGFVSGSGSINSPAGAYIPDVLKAGKATFAFNMRYKLGSNLPTGPTSFNFSLASLKFSGVIYEWLVVAGDKAQFKGTGTIANDAGNYGFIVTAADGQQNGATGIDKFRIKIWAINTDGSTGSLVYDNDVTHSPDDVDTATLPPISTGNVLVFLDTAPSAVTSSIDPATVTENEQYTFLTGSFTDPDLGDPHTLTVDWGDGSAVSTVSLNAGFFTFSVNHPYVQNNPPTGPYLIKVTVGDSYGKSGTGNTPAPVTNVPPVISGGTWPTAPVAIGAPVTVKANFTDAGIKDTHTCTFSWGDSSAPGSGVVTETTAAIPAAYMSGSCTSTHSYTVGGDHLVTITVTDGDGGSAVSGDITISVNTPVSITSLGVSPTAISENGVATLSGVLSDPESSVHTVTINWGDGTASTTINLDPAVVEFYANHTYKDDNPTGTASDVYTISVSATDNIGAAATRTTTITVNNVPPVVSGITPGTANPGVSATFAASFTDAGTLDTHTCQFSWGDSGTGPGTVTETNGSGSCNAAHTYSAVGSYTVTVTVTDDDGGSGTATRTVAVSTVNSPPVMTGVSASPNPVNEGTLTTLAGSFTDSGDTGTHTVTIVWGDGPPNTTLTLASGVFNFSTTHKYLDDSPSGGYTVNVTVKDSSNATATASTNVTVNNVSPSITSVLINTVATTNTVLLGSAATVKVNFTDAGTKDTHTCLITWGDSSPDSSPAASETNGSGSCTAARTYAASGTYSGMATVTDDDGGVKQSAFTVKVTVAPVVSNVSLSSNSINENATVTFSGSFTDPDAGDTHKVTIVWADGSANTVINLAAGVLSFSTTHKYLDDNPTATSSDVYNINVTVADGSNASSSSSTSITVNNVAPVITTANAAAVTLPLWVDFTDVGTKDTHRAWINWGDGPVEVAVSEANGVGYLTGDHTWTSAGPHTVIITVTDDDTGTVSKSFVVN